VICRYKYVAAKLPNNKVHLLIAMTARYRTLLVLFSCCSVAIGVFANLTEPSLAVQLDIPPVPPSNETNEAADAPPAPKPVPADSPPSPTQPASSDGPPTPTVDDQPTPPRESPAEVSPEGTEEDTDKKKSKAEQAAPLQKDRQKDKTEQPGFFANLIRWLGNFHPLTVHFPIALLFVAALAEVLWAVLEKSGFRFAARFCLWLGALGAVTSATLGWFLAGFQLTDPTWIRTTHRWLGTSLAVWGILTLVLSEANERRNSVPLERTFWATLFLGVALVGTTGFFGGAMVYGLGHYRWPGDGVGAEKTKSEKLVETKPAVVVEMNDEFKFDPEKVTIVVGESVMWKGVGNYPHTVTADPDKAADSNNVRLPEGAPTFDSGRVQPGETFTYTFEVPGSYRYFCIPHELSGMVGEVTVKPGED